MYVSNDGILQPYQSGAFNLTSTQAKGTNFFVSNMASHNITSDDFDNFNTLKSDTLEQKRLSYKKDILDFNAPHLAPSLDEHANIKNFRYLMSEKNKVDLLGKKDLAHDVLAGMFGSMEDKHHSKPFNDRLIDLLISDYEINKDILPEKDFKVVSRASDDYKLLPTSTQVQLDKVFGKGKPIKLRKDLQDIVFGYRKFSAANWVSDKVGLPPLFRKALRLSGDLYEWVVSKGKRVIVVLTPQVPLMNMVSNIILLSMKGVPIRAASRVAVPLQINAKSASYKAL